MTDQDINRLKKTPLGFAVWLSYTLKGVVPQRRFETRVGRVRATDR